MRGLVLGFDSSMGTGLLRGDDGRRYVFAIDDWLAKPKPRPGQVVDFELHKGMALEIYVIKNASPLDRVVLGDTLTFISRRISSFSKRHALSEKLILPLLLVLLFAMPMFAHEAREFSGYNTISYVRHMLATTSTLSAIGSTETREVMQAGREALYIYLLIYILPFWAAYKLMRGLQGAKLQGKLFGISLAMVLVPLILPLMSLMWFFIMAPSGNATLKRSVMSNLYLGFPEAYLNYSWGVVIIIGLGLLGLLDALRKRGRDKAQGQADARAAEQEMVAAMPAPAPVMAQVPQPQRPQPQPQPQPQPPPQPQQPPQPQPHPQEAPQQQRPIAPMLLPQGQPEQQAEMADPRPRPPQQRAQQALPQPTQPQKPRPPLAHPQEAYPALEGDVAEENIYADGDDISELLKRIREE